LSGTFGGPETQHLNGPETFEKFYKDFELPAEEAAERTRQQGKEPDAREHKKKLKRVPKSIKKKKNFIDRLTLVEKAKIEEIQRQKIEKMVEDILLGKKTGEPELTEKNQSLSKLLTKNLESIKKIAEKEGISISDLIKVLKKSE